MTRVVRNAALFCAAGILVASAALANVPDPAHSTDHLSYTYVGGTNNVDPGGTPDNCSDGNCQNYDLNVRDFANNLIAGSIVILDYSACPDIRIACVQLAGFTNLGGKKVQGTTDALGHVTFKVYGAANGALPPTGQAPGTAAGSPCAVIYADGVPLGNLRVAAYDLNLTGVNQAVTTADANISLQGAARISAGTATPLARLDVTHDGTQNSADASLHLNLASQASAGTGSNITAPGGTGFCP